MKPAYVKSAAGVAVVGAIAAAAWAAAPEQKSDKGRGTPPGWSYDVGKDGKKVLRVPRTENPDGSWTEQYKAGNCTVTRTGRQGEFRETRKCD